MDKNKKLTVMTTNLLSFVSICMSQFNCIDDVHDGVHVVTPSHCLQLGSSKVQTKQ